ncbi:hypothetical protein LZ31DRAFT_540234 [Colletotrichum somersetense]|nr:hypothetical protein LZ31DRAFT_540234 [Colletotrichum somersetense]
MNGLEQDLTHCDLNFSLPNDELLNASRWSSLLKLGDIPTIKVSLNFYSDGESDTKSSVVSSGSSKTSKSSSTKGRKVKSDTSLDLDDNAKCPQQGTDDAVSNASKVFGFDWSHSRQKFVDFTIAENATANLPDDVPKLNSKVPPFFDWKPKAGAGIAQATADRFRERLDEVETDLLQLYKYQHSKTNIAIRQVYDAFGTNIYEEAPHNNFVDFSHRRRSHMKDFELASGSGVSGTKLNRLAEDFFSVSIPALEAFVVSAFNSSLTLKYFGALSKVVADPTSSELLQKSDDDTEPHETVHSEDKSRQKWVVSRKLIEQADLRFILGLSTDKAKCPNCKRGAIYANFEKGVSHLRKMHLVGSKTDRMLRDYLLPLPAALTERLSEELCELLVASRNMLASTLRKLLAIQSGVIHDNEFRGSERGIPYYLVDSFKLIVLFVCALPEALHELRWFYHDFDYNSQDLTSQKAQTQRTAMERLVEVTGDLIRKAERTLVSPTGLAEENNAEHFMTSVGLNYLSLQIMSNLLRRPVHNRKKVSELYASYAKNLGSEIQRKPSKRQIPQIGALSNELNLLKDVVELQKDYVESFYVLIMPETLHPSLAKELDREKLFGIESDLLSELLDTVKQDDESLDVTLELCNALKGLTSELTEIMADDQGRAVFVFTVVTVTFLPLSFVASYLSMSGGTDGLGMEWGDVQARFWMVAGPLTVAVAVFCFYIAGRGTLGRLLSGPTSHAVTKDKDADSGDEGDDDASYDVDSGGSAGRERRGRRWWLRWGFRGWRRRNYSSSNSGSTSSSSSYILDD